MDKRGKGRCSGSRWSIFSAKDVANAIYYPIPLHLQPAYQPFAEPGTRFPVAEKVSKEIISLPMFPELEDNEIETVISALVEFFRQSN